MQDQSIRVTKTTPALIKVDAHPGIYQRGSRYVVPYRHQGRQHKPAFRTLDEAVTFKAELTLGIAKPASSILFTEYAREWITNHQVSDATRLAYADSLERFAIPYFDRRRAKLQDIDRKAVRGYVHHLQSLGLAPASVKVHYTPVRSLFATAFDDDVIRTNPATKITIKAKRTEKPKALKRSELLALLNAMPEGQRLMYRFWSSTGLRSTELFGLQWGDITMGDQPSVTIERGWNKVTHEIVPLKTESSYRTIPISHELAADLQAAHGHKGKDDVLFTTSRGARLGHRNVLRTIYRAAERAGLDWRPATHTFRHTFASIALDSGRNIVQVSKLLGHAHTSMTLNVYSHLVDDGLGGPVDLGLSANLQLVA